MPASKPRPNKDTSLKGKPAAARQSSGRGSRKQDAPPRRRGSAAVQAPGGLSPERKLDLLGITLALTGLITLLSLLTSNRGSLTGGWVHFLGLLFGWGVVLLPLGLLLVGLWLVLRNVERIPPFSLERVTGLVLLYLCLLTILHRLAGGPEVASELADAGLGGGYLGGLSLRILWAALGSAGALIAILAWLLISLTMTLDLSVPEMVRRLGPVWDRLGRIWQTLRSRPPRNAPAHQPPLGEEFTPLTRPAPPLHQPLPAAPAQVGAAPSPSIAWALPPVKDILDPGSAPAVNKEFIEQRARLIEDTLASFGAPVQVVEINRGPMVTQFGVEPNFIETRNGRTRVRVSKIVALADDLALALAAPRIRIQAPVPGHSYVGIEVPNDEMTLVSLRDILEGEAFQRSRKPLSFPLGRAVSGHPALAELTAMPHLLIAGTTGSGKSVCVNAILTCFLLHNSPDDLRLILVDPKRVELTGYNGIPHLLAPVVVELERVIGALQWMTREMDKRYHTFAQVGARNITDYNARMQAQGDKKLPFLVVVIDELADLMMLAPDETERTITRLAQLARATGIHMILATQRPSVDVVTGLIKANFPARIAFAVASGVDSRVILDQPGAERLLGRGDMLYQAPDAPAPVRLQGVFVSEPETQRLVEYWRTQAGQSSPYALPGPPVDAVPSGVPLKQVPMWEDMSPVASGDPLLGEAIDIVRREGRASVSMLQRKLRIGYTRAARLVDVMEEQGIVGPPEGATQVRQVLDYGPAAPPAEE
jgi:DNA segregation ATPase FtsK/SpoIIIE, S-DNA-T family